VRAAKAGDLRELRAIMPEIGEEVMESDDLSYLPTLFDARARPALENASAPPVIALGDCNHDWYSFEGPLAARDKCAELKEQAESKGEPFDEVGMRRWLTKGDVGRCRRDVQHLGPFWRCTSCRLVLCHTCNHVRHKNQAASRAIDELKKEKQQEATHAAEVHRKVKEGAPPDGVKSQWRQHPERPQPFFVIDQEKVSDEEKMIWIRQELGSDATLSQFCAKYIELFGARKVGEIQQKGACLKLYALYAPDSREAAWKKEGDLPPRDLVEFQRVWNPEAPNRCLECRKSIGNKSDRDTYCSDKCKRAGVVATCTRCTPERKCLYCTAAPSWSALGKRKFDTSKLDEAIRRSEEQLKRTRQMLGHERRSADPDHEPAWKRRRRS